MKIVVLLMSFFVAQSVFALECNVIVYTEKEIVEGRFVAPEVSQGHGGDEQTVKGEFNEVTAMADGQWLGISWKQNDELIADSVNLIKDSITQPRVLIVYNPKNVDEQVSIDCSK